MDNWKVVERKADQHDMVITAECAVAPDVCVRCGVAEPSLKKYGLQEQFFMDTPIHGKRAAIRIMRQRYKCLECGGTFQQLLPDMDEKRHMTRRLLSYIRQRSLERTFTEVAQDVGLDEKTVRNIFQDFATELDCNYTPATPEWLGIDELLLVRKLRCMLTNVKENSVVDILEERSKEAVGRWLSNTPNPEAIKVVTMDMWRPYRDVAYAMLPNAKVVVDKFHIVRMANLALDQTRKRLREGLDSKARRRLMHDRHVLLRRRSQLKSFDYAVMQVWTLNMPELGAIYDAKEDFYSIWDEAADKAEAIERYEKWKAGLSTGVRKNMHDVIRAVENWKPEIFNYFDVRVTNAYTEAMNGMAKIANRTGRGYSFEAIRAKILFGQALHVRKPKFDSGDLTRFELFRSMEHATTDDYGVSVQSLVDLYGVSHDSDEDTQESE